MVIVLLGGGAFAAYKMGIYGTRRSQESLGESARKGTAQVSIEFINEPAWLVEGDHIRIGGQSGFF